MTREEYNDQRQGIIDDYIATGQYARYRREIDRLNRAAVAAGLFAGSE